MFATELRSITKRFKDVVALDGADLAVRSGTVHGLLGENGAGKSTLMSILAGFEQPDAGELLVGGIHRRMRSPRHAQGLGVGLVQQHVSVVSTLTVAQNVFLGNEGSVRIDDATLNDRVAAVAEEFGVDIAPTLLGGDLSVGERQRLELVRVLVRRPGVLLLDEPTAVLTPDEVDELFAVVRRIAEDGCSVVVVTHKLGELIRITDEITVMRAGRTIARHRTEETTVDRLLGEVVGDPGAVGWQQELLEAHRSTRVASATPGGPVAAGTGAEPRADDAGGGGLTVRDLTVCDGNGIRRLDGVSLDVAPGTVLGIGGVEGNGQRELVGVLTGLVRPTGGELAVDGAPVDAHPVALAAAGVRVITEDRHGTGLALDLSVADNLIYNRLDDRAVNRSGVLRRRAIRAHVEALIDTYRVKVTSGEVRARLLSGGNQQKVVVARELSLPTRVLVASQPTRGLDMGAISDVVRRIVAARDRGVAVCLISSDLDELLALSDEVVFLNAGRASSPVRPEELDRPRLGALVSGLDRKAS